MRILNPIYDTVFKYLMEDLDIAKGLISRIIGKNVVELTPAPHEQTATLLRSKFVQVELQRLDYVAIIKTFDKNRNPIFEKVLVEVQKSPFTPEIGRFRKYLAEKYKNISVLQTENGEEQRYLPIKTIYLIEKTFNENLPSILKSNNQYIDVLQKKEYKGAKDEFVNLLTHEAYFIQLGILPHNLQNSLIRLLSLFTTWFREKNERFVDYPDLEIEQIKDRIIRRMLRRLHGASENEKVKMEMEMEIEYDDAIEKNLAIAEKLKAEVKLTKQELRETKQEIKQTKQELRKKDQVLAEKNQVLAQKDQVLAQKDQVLAQKDQVLAQKDQVLAEKDQVLAEKDQVLAQKDQKLIETAKELKRLGLPVEQIIKLTDLTANQIENLD